MVKPDGANLLIKLEILRKCSPIAPPFPLPMIITFANMFEKKLLQFSDIHSLLSPQLAFMHLCI